MFSVTEGTTPVDWVLNGVEAGAVLVDKTIVMASYSEGTLFLFDTLGVLKRASGGLGNGPGEFRSIATVHATNDGFGAWDPQARRYSYFTLDGMFSSSFTPAGWRQPQAVGATREGTVFREYALVSGEPQRYVLVDSTGAETAVFMGPNAYGRARVRYYDAARNANRTIAVGRDCAPNLLEIASRDRLYIADPKAGTVSAIQIGADGDPEDRDQRIREIYREEQRRLVTDSVLQRIRAQYPEAPEDSLKPYLTAVGNLGDPLTAWRSIVYDAELGLVFLEDARCAERNAPPRWTVVDTAGNLQGSFALPPAHNVLASGSGLIIAVHRDSLGVEHGRLYRLPSAIGDGR